jgi:hypothetical protein
LFCWKNSGGAKKRSNSSNFLPKSAQNQGLQEEFLKSLQLQAKARFDFGNFWKKLSILAVFGPFPAEISWFPVRKWPFPFPVDPFDNLPTKSQGCRSTRTRVTAQKVSIMGNFDRFRSISGGNQLISGPEMAISVSCRPIWQLNY